MQEMGSAGSRGFACAPLASPCKLSYVDRGNNNAHALRVNSDLIAFAMLTFAYSTESVNGVPGKKVPGRPFHLPAPAGPEGTFAEESGGGLSHGATS